MTAHDSRGRFTSGGGGGKKGRATASKKGVRRARRELGNRIGEQGAIKAASGSRKLGHAMQASARRVLSNTKALRRGASGSAHAHSTTRAGSRTVRRPR